MACPASLTTVLGDLTASLWSTLDAASKIDSVEGPQAGLSLLNTKNELLLSYLQHLVFLVLLKIRNNKAEASESVQDDTPEVSMASVVEKLVELRLYLEKGVRPLEEKLRFQIEKALRAANDAERREKRVSVDKKDDLSASSSDSSSGFSHDDNDNDEASGSESHARQNERTNSGPVLSSMSIPKRKLSAGRGEKDPSRPYRPPKNRPVLMPSLRKERDESQRKSMKSRTIEEYINSELLPRPLEQPSIGSTIAERGRVFKTAAQRREEDERRDYEESNLVRLPNSSRKERKQGNAVEGRHARMTFGGEEWLDLDTGVRRIEALTAKKGPTGVKGALERSRKRYRDAMSGAAAAKDGQRGPGNQNIEIGDRYRKKLKFLERGTRGKGRKK